MRVFENVKELQAFIDQYFIENAGVDARTIGFVPTMGALHQGHISLIERSRAENKLTICSIFVNPTQFDDPKDLVLYPRTLDADKVLLESAGCDVLFAPAVTQIYPEKTERLDAPVALPAELIGIDLGYLGAVMEAKHRKGHFEGVMQVVYRLFNIVKPSRAYFGQKDFQQLAIVRKMAEATQLQIEVIGCPIVREPDGLAMSSRNRRLSAEERQLATVLYKALLGLKEQVLQKQPLTAALDWAHLFLKAQPGLELEYLEAALASSLAPLQELVPGELAVACVAARVGKVRNRR